MTSNDPISVGLIVLGAFIAGSRDLSFDAYGYAVVFVANITTAIYLASIARIGSTIKLANFSVCVVGLSHYWCVTFIYPLSFQENQAASIALASCGVMVRFIV